MFTVTKTLIIGAASVLSASTTSANDTSSVTFRYDRALSVEANYVAFEMNAKRACEGISNLNGHRAVKKCRISLVAAAVEATKLGSFIAYHQSRTNAVQVASVQR